MADYQLDSNAKYARTHEWVRIEDGLAVVGISDAAQDMLSDVVYVELPQEGDEVEAGQEVAVVESVKAAEDVIAPVSGKVVAVNRALEDKPELVNEQPYQAWFFKLEPTAALEEELAQLMSPEEYDRFVDEESH
ncbi:glycine cleavage system protein GcvH [Litorilinea aerophila]|uniref:Glycine cleavage system H protein n=1 Tax=Litorilinea aerophila TaxID=1204385 RepID=A0A540VFV3_9CHLR|nr:glycine cleavage system protein GcvH [Litorilinea aerophila]MCC9076645.1 glycine cleavage system protein GcvH [Litorilinea aerophila]OUC06416.1 glycine cleavage system protein H [Litorilinea aerophila]GIV77681.1 MAG: glycine cleavage system H protein [Litorilinea sp.]